LTTIYRGGIKIIAGINMEKIWKRVGQRKLGEKPGKKL